MYEAHADADADRRLLGEIGAEIGRPAQEWGLLADSLWSRIFELGDGSVLKLVRARSQGLGGGLSKLDREAQILPLLDGLLPPGLTAPRLLDTGRFSEPASAYAGWLRLERIEGKTLGPRDLMAMAAPQREALGRDLGRAMARLHRATLPLLASAAAFGDPIQRCLHDLGDRFNDPEDLDAIAELAQAWARRADAAVVLHGDFHLGNLIWQPDGSLVLLDWAEVGVGAKEAELRHFVHMSPLADAVWDGYAESAPMGLDLRRYRQAGAVDAFLTLAIEGPDLERGQRDRLRRRVDEALAALEAWPD